MPHKDPTQYQLITYAWVVGLSVMGGMVSFFRKVQARKTRTFNITEFIGEIVTSGFVGVLTFYFCEQAEINPLLTAFAVGVSGHMGSRLIFMIEQVIEQYAADRVRKALKIKDDE